jgi:hypothetical protein
MKQLKSIARSRAFLAGMVAAVAVCFVSCTEKGDYFSLEELGAKENTYVVDTEAGVISVEVLSNKSYDLSFANTVDWASLKTTRMSGDGTFDVNYDANSGFPRMATIFIQGPGNADTVYLKQHGLMTPELTFPNQNIIVKGEGGPVEADIQTNVDFEDMAVVIEYTSEEGIEWISQMDIVDGKFVFEAQGNSSETKLRNARITLSYVDGWNQKIASTLYLTQANALNELGQKVSIPELRGMSGSVIYDDIILEGYVVSDKGNPNVASNPHTTTTKIDYSVNEKTVYIESLDGQYGIKLVTSTKEDNIFTRYSKVQVLLKGTTVNSEQVDDIVPGPARYKITGVTSAKVLTSVAGTAGDLPKKERTIAELTDDDIYTFVTLRQCELPIGAGPFTPLNEGYGSAYNQQRIDTYPQVVRDIHGNDLYMMVNLGCPWRRDGSEIPHGSGDISGVVVHDEFQRFEEDGNIGRYQIRPLTRDDIAVDPLFENGFSAVIAEWSNMPEAKIENNAVAPTVGEGSLTYSLQGENGANTISKTTSYSYLGPITGIEKNDPNADNKGALANAALVASKWWDEDNNRSQAWIVSFSTADVQTTQLSMQLGVMNCWNPGAPRYWVAEWSTHGDMLGAWTEIGRYTVPDLPVWGNTLLTQLPGWKNLSMPLPLDMLGMEKVYIRLKAAENNAGTATAYSGGEIVPGQNNAINYLCIRYNK